MAVVIFRIYVVDGQRQELEKLAREYIYILQRALREGPGLYYLFFIPFFSLLIRVSKTSAKEK